MHIHGLCLGQRQAVLPSEDVIHPFSERLVVSTTDNVEPTLLSLLPLATPLRRLRISQSCNISSASPRLSAASNASMSSLKEECSAAMPAAALGVIPCTSCSINSNASPGVAPFLIPS